MNRLPLALFLTLTMSLPAAASPSSADRAVEKRLDDLNKKIESLRAKSEAIGTDARRSIDREIPKIQAEIDALRRKLSELQSSSAKRAKSSSTR